MAQTPEGGKKAAKSNKERYGEDYYRNIGKLGGKAGTGYKFGHGKVDPHEAGRVGGTRSKRGKASEYHTNPKS
jgi:general stress protein YciG